MTDNNEVRGKVVKKYVSTSSHGGMVAVVSNDYSDTYVTYDDYAAIVAERDALRADAARLDYIERTFSGMTNRERYLPVQMIWGKGCNGRTLREACDKHMARDAAMAAEGRE